jgi:hypothetical protein
MLRLSSPTVDVGVFSICTGITVVLVFWWVFFTESLSGTDSVVGVSSERAIG